MAHDDDTSPGTSAVGDSYAAGESALRELREPLREWLEQNALVDEEVGTDAVVEALTVAVGGLLTVRPGAVLTRLGPEDVEALVSRVVPAMVADTGTPDPEDMEEDLQAVFYQFLRFLGDTGRWTGSEGDLETDLTLLAGEPPEIDVVMAEAAAEVDEAEEDTTVLASFPVLAARAVLEHVGEGLDVPDDEELAADDVTAVLASFEHRVPITADVEGEPQRLEDVPWLRQVVLTMLELDLLDGEDETLLVPGAEADGWLQPVPEARELRRHLVGRFVLDDPATLDGGFSVAEAVLPTILASAMAGTPFDEAALGELVENAAALGPAAGVAVDELRERMSDLAVFGIVSEEPPWTVARGYWPALAAAVAAGGGEGDVLGDLFGEEGEPHWFESVMGQLGMGGDQVQQIRNILGGR